MMLKWDLATLGLGTNSEHERDAEEYWRDLEMLRSCAAEVGAPRGRSSWPGRVCRNATCRLTRCQGTNLVLHTRPYRNVWIIHMICVLYFSGGLNSFSVRFCQLFPTGLSDNGHGILEREVPMPMVALVATAVSYFLSNSCK